LYFLFAQKTQMIISNLSSPTILPEYQNLLQGLENELAEQLSDPKPVQSAMDVEALEVALQNTCRQFADRVAAVKIQASIDSDALQEEVQQLITLQPCKVRHQGIRHVNIRFSGGSLIEISVPYYARKTPTKKREKGMYPALLLLGVHDRCTPLLASEISRASASLCSLEEARQVMNDRGCMLNIKSIRNVVKRYAARARLAQQQGNSDLSVEAKGIAQRKVVISTDGGRVRIRSNKRGPKTKKGRNRYHTDWREPKLMIIYVVDEQGRLDKAYSPFIDGTMQGPDQVFALMAYYLKKLNICAAEQILFVADGALWIWERVKKLAIELKIKASSFYELIDFYHVVEHLNALAKMKSDWSEKQRKSWVKKQRHNLRWNEPSSVIESIKLICKGSRNKLLKREREYFIKNIARMKYHEIAEKNMPIGSGAIESSIRRVINMRLKGPCIFWHSDTADEMILLRSYHKSGRWSMLNEMACKPIA